MLPGEASLAVIKSSSVQIWYAPSGMLTSAMASSSRIIGWLSAQSGVTAFIPGSPFMKGFARETEMPAGLSHASRQLVDVTDDL